MKYAFLLLLLATATLAEAQTTAPADRRDSVRVPSAPTLSGSRMLPPSMILELHRAQGKRTVLYRDTVRGSDIGRLHQNDSVEREYVDSAFTLSDTAVSLSHIEWLDSQLVEIPELERFGSKVHFTYPPAIMVETQVQPVPFDTSLLAHMNPVSRDNLPFFDQSPMPLPLRSSTPFEGYLEAGAGNLYLPITAGWLSTTLNQRSYIDARAGYRARSSSAVRELFSAAAGYHAQLGVDPAEEAYASTNLSFGLSYDRKQTELRTTLNSSDSLKALGLFGARLLLVGDISDKFHYDLSAEDKEFRDAYRSGLSESGQDLEASIHYDPYISHFRFIVEGGYHTAGLRIDTSIGISYAAGSANQVSGMYAKAFFGRRKGEAFEWYGGVAVLQGKDARGQSHSILSPAGRIRLPLNPRWEAGGYFEPDILIASERALSIQNPFYSPYAAHAVGVLLGDTNLLRLDARSVILDRTRFGAFMDYALSPDDRLRLEARWTSRTGEPVFHEHPVDSSVRVFSVEPLDVRRLVVSFGSNLLLFDRDVLTSTIDYSTATATASDQSLPFEPTLKVNVAYHFNSVASWLQPTLEFRALSRTDRTITLVNAEAHVPLASKISIFVRAENLAGSASDFWTGYPESPRSIWATFRLSF